MKNRKYIYKNSGLDFKSKKNGIQELKSRLLFVILALLIFRIGSFIPIPGIDVTVIAKLFENQKGTIIEMFNTFSGGSLSRASIFALGIMPHISSSIIVQLLTMIHPKFVEMKKSGEEGISRINQYTRYGTVILATLQSVGISIGLPSMPGMEKLVIHSDLTFYGTAIISLVCGTMFLMWLGEKISEKGIGNGISIIIFSAIITGLPPSMVHTIEQARQGRMNIIFLIMISLFMFSVIFLVVFIERGQRRILVNYARRQQGRRIYSAQKTHLPLKVNISGVIPAIFASSVILFPATIASWFGRGANLSWLKTISLYLEPGQPVYILLYASAIVFFCFFYTSLMFNPVDTAENLKKSGAFISGIRPGEQTAKYIRVVSTRLTVIGSIYITFICLVPEFMRNFMKVHFYFGGTSLLIVVVVIMDFISQIQTLMISNQYESILKKTNLK